MFCTKTGQVFDSFTEAAKALEVDSWTLSRKIETNGYFVDKDGLIWEREHPMVSKNKYPKMSPYYKPKRKYVRHKKKEDLEAEDQQIIQSFIEVGTKKDCPNFIVSALAEKTKALMIEKGIWDEICEAMEYCGLKSFTVYKGQK